jgi:ABC-2 type transport system ATP-binding protein
VLAGGRILKEGAPSDLVAQLSGKVWKKTIDRAELEAERAQNQIISTRLAGGRTVIHVLADRAPDPDFQVTPPGLEDVYFSTLTASRRAA